MHIAVTEKRPDCEIVDIKNRSLLFECIAGANIVSLEFPTGTNSSDILKMMRRAQKRLRRAGYFPEKCKLKVI